MSLDSVFLTPRETEIVKLLAHELTYKQIGQRLGISHRTVKAHVHHIATKIGPHRLGKGKRRVERWAMEAGITPWGQ